jgi:hypothetical protein
MILWGCSFYDARLSVQKDDAAHIQFVGCSGVGDKAAKIEDTLSPDALAAFSSTLDDLRRLGEMDLKLNHPDDGQTLAAMLVVSTCWYAVRQVVFVRAASALRSG